ncbi:MAG: DNA glycosylase AlkZ-like family protein [Deinococcus sp.]
MTLAPTLAQPTLAQLRAYAAARTLFPRAGLQGALDRLGFVQADPIRAPARAQDLQLMQRVRGYRAGDLERRYSSLEVEEDILPNYGFVTPEVHSLLHPRQPVQPRIERDAPGLMLQVLAHVQQAGRLHPQQAAAVFGRLRVGNAWGGGSSAATRALEALHHAGELRVLGREGGVKVYGPASRPPQPALSRQERARGIVEVMARLYAPLPRQSLGYLLSLCGYGAPGLGAELRQALREAEGTWLTSAAVDGLSYLWPADEEPDADPPAGVRLVAPFDPLVWDRRRLAHLHGWNYRFEAYTPPAKRVLGYYALPLFWRERALGWANLRVQGGELLSEVAWVPGVRRTGALSRALNAELERYRLFLGLK